MHGSAHDKAQRQRSVLQCGKCVQRALRGVVTRLRTRRTLVATVALVLLVLTLLGLCHARLLSHRNGAHDNADAVADDSTSHVAASPSDRWLLRPDAQHGGSVRVMLLMVSTRVDEQLCYALASAYFADLPVVVIGYGALPFLTSMKPSLYLDAMQRAGLRDRDVVLLLDSDILFSGEDMLPFIDDYIARSPAAPSALDVRAVRAGTARAPSLYTGELNCYTPQTFASEHEKCALVYTHTDHAIAAYVAKHNFIYDLHDASVQPLRYLNSGVSIHRVWSARELLRTYVHYIATHKPQNNGAVWWCDQSVFALFYNDLRVWEVEHDVLRNNSTAAATAQRGPHGLRAGQLQLEQTGRLAPLLRLAFNYNYLSEHAWRDNVSTASQDVMPYDGANLQLYSDNVWRRYGGSVRLQQRTLTRAGNGTHTVDLTPPLLYVASRLDVAHNNTPPAVLTSPLMWHIAGPHKDIRSINIVRLLPWYVPMQYNVTRWQQGRAQVLASHIELWTATMNATQRVRYGDVCQQHNPFL